MGHKSRSYKKPSSNANQCYPGISIPFLAIDFAGAIFCMLSLAFKPNFDAIAAATYLAVMVRYYHTLARRDGRIDQGRGSFFSFRSKIA